MKENNVIKATVQKLNELEEIDEQEDKSETIENEISLQDYIALEKNKEELLKQSQVIQPTSTNSKWDSYLKKYENNSDKEDEEEPNFTTIRPNIKDTEVGVKRKRPSSKNDPKPTVKNPTKKSKNDEASTMSLCTYTVTGKNNLMDQHWYYCYTCKLTASEGVCGVCVKVCHKEHNVSYSRKSRFYCSCGSGARSPCKCLVPRNVNNQENNPDEGDEEKIELKYYSNEDEIYNKNSFPVNIIKPIVNKPTPLMKSHPKLVLPSGSLGSSKPKINPPKINLPKPKTTALPNTTTVNKSNTESKWSKFIKKDQGNDDNDDEGDLLFTLDEKYEEFTEDTM